MKQNSKADPSFEMTSGLIFMLRIVWALTILAIAVLTFCIARDLVDLSYFGMHFATVCISFLWIFVTIIEWARRYEKKSTVPTPALAIFTVLSGFAVLCAVSDDTFEWATWLNLLLSVSCGVALFAKLEGKMHEEKANKKLE